MKKTISKMILSMFLAMVLTIAMLVGNVQITMADEGDTDPWEWVPDQFQYQGEDGADWIGYSGCFITEAAYNSGNPWNDDVKLQAFPDNIVYYVHASSIQGVVDKLLALADTDVDVVDMWNHGEPAIKHLNNSGYILLNVSCREASTMKTLPTEEYVYAPASVRGVLINASSNAYMIGSSVESSETVYEVALSEPNTIVAKNTAGVSDEEAKGVLHGLVVYDIDRLQDYWGNIGFTNPESQRILEKVVYKPLDDTWEKTGFYYVVNDGDILTDEEGNHFPVEAFAVNFKDINRWPTLHVNASTQVKVDGAWKDDAELYIGFYDGETASTKINGHDYTISNVGQVNTESYSVEYNGYNVDDDVIKHIDVPTSVKVHVVKAESNKNVADTYSEDGKKTEILVDEKAVSDLVKFTPTEKEQLIDGATLDLDMSVAKVDDTTGDSSISNAISSIETELEKEANSKDVDYIDANLSYKIKANGEDSYGTSKTITETNEPMTISVPVSSDLKGKTNYAVYRYHEGVVDKLAAVYDDETGMLEFETDKFSVYALAADSDGSSTGCKEGNHVGGTIVKNKKAATYFAKGYTGDVVCKSCNTVIKKGKSIAVKKLAKVKLSSIKSSKSKTITVKWKKQKDATGYEIQYSTDKNFKKAVKTVKIKKASQLSTTIKKLSGNKKYYVRIRGYKTGKVNNKAKTVTSKWSEVKKVVVKK